LERFPNVSVEILTNSILTSDNYFTQSVIDMDTAPRLLLNDELREVWVKSMKGSELNPDYINSQAWLEAVNNPRVTIYQTGRRDSTILGGEQEYGKLHAKFFFSEQIGFIGTSNFDYRSRLYNNEMGYYFYGE
jgi:phosphatidylserine/phosphatidylglycerophosphate/cardiolipin synthase-like enzyme